MAYYRFKSARDCFAFYYKGNVDFPISKDTLKAWKAQSPEDKELWKESYKKIPFTNSWSPGWSWKYPLPSNKQKTIVIINKDIV